MWAESEKGQGSTFYIEWVLASAPENAVPTKRHDERVIDSDILAGSRVLLAEDQPLNVEIAKKLLSKKQIVVDAVPNGQLAVDCMGAMEPGYYDAILMDIRMPVMNGLDAARAIRALDHPDAKTIPIVAMTANAFDEDVQEALLAGMNAHLAKPVDPAKLYGVLANLMSASQSESL